MPEHEEARQRRSQAHGESRPVHFAQAPAFASSVEATMPGDSKLQQDVLAELAWEPSVDHADIGVSAADGVVTLTGYVKSYVEKLAAQRAAQRVAGVRALADDLKVRYASDAKTADHEIARRIVDMLAWSAVVPEGSVRVKVEQGWVTLTGNVDWQYQSRAARKIAATISGVTHVVDCIQVGNSVSVADVRQRIEEALRRQADLDAASVTVAVDGRKVTLAGKVHGWRERQVAQRAAWNAPGITRVEDHIRVI
jgi:osmotically-inducible protein OsmY